MSDRKRGDVEAELARFRERYLVFNREAAANPASTDFASDNRLVEEQGAFQLREFVDAEPRGKVPVLIVYSHVNRPDIIDLDHAHSLVQRLQETGNRVFLVDWQRTTEADKDNDLSLYVLDAVGEAMARVSALTGHQRINLAGICQGGTFALSHACLRPQSVRRLALLVTPVDFHRGDSLIRHWSRKVHFDRLAAHPVNIPGGLITLMFQFARPFDDLRRHVKLIGLGDEERDLAFSLRMDRWAHDCPDQPGRAFAQFMGRLYQDNALVEGTLQLRGEPVNLSRLDMPVLNVFADNDHLVPPESSAALGDYVDAQHYREMRFCGGHIGLMVSARAQAKLLPDVGRWLASEQE